MMARPLTAPMVDRLQPDPTKRIEVSDGLLPALRIVIQPNGAKSYAVRFRQDGRPRKFTIGSTDRFSLAQARDAARGALSSVANGKDPMEVKRAKRLDARAVEDRVEIILEDFLKRHVAKLKSAPHVERLLRVELKPWHGRRVQDVAKRDVIRLIDAVHDRGSPTTARRLLANLKRFFSWLVERDILPASPAATVKPPSDEVQRERVLTDEELHLVLLAADRLGWPFGPMVKLLALTGTRRDEVAGMRWAELDLSGAAPSWRLPPERTKNGRAHDIPLSSAAVDILRAAPRIRAGQGDPVFVFTTTGTTAISGFSKARLLLDRLIAAIRLSEAAAAGLDAVSLPPFEPWRLHDLRRTFASGCAKLGVSLPVVEKCLNHVSGSFAGIVGIYQRHDFAAEKRAAFYAWAEHVVEVNR